MPDRDILNLCWSPDSSELFILTNGQGTWVCHPQQPNSVPERFAEDAEVMTFSMDSRHLFFTTGGGELHIWGTQPYRPILRVPLPGEGKWLRLFASPDPNHVLVWRGTYDSDNILNTSKIWLYHVLTGELLFTPDHDEVIHPIPNADGCKLFYMDFTSIGYLWDIDTGSQIAKWESNWLHNIPEQSVSQCRWYEEQIVGYFSKYDREKQSFVYHAVLWNPTTNEEQFFNFEDLTTLFESFRWATDKIRMDTETEYDDEMNVFERIHAQIWNPAQKRIYMEFDMEEYQPLALSSDGSLLARSQPDGIALYDVLTGSLLRTIKLEI